MTVVLKGQQIDAAIFLIRRAALKLEIAGFKRKGRSAYSIIKQEYGLKGSPKLVLQQMDRVRDQLIGGQSCES
jgi:hypothetical protein